ncbi:MAG: hypothetical protein EAY75_03880, partial [Bacteroidetes bacterium]
GVARDCSFIARKGAAAQRTVWEIFSLRLCGVDFWIFGTQRRGGAKNGVGGFFVAALGRGERLFFYSTQRRGGAKDGVGGFALRLCDNHKSESA